MEHEAGKGRSGMFAVWPARAERTVAERAAFTVCAFSADDRRDREERAHLVLDLV